MTTEKLITTPNRLVASSGWVPAERVMVNSNFCASWQERSTKHLLLARELQRPAGIAWMTWPQVASKKEFSEQSLWFPWLLCRGRGSSSDPFPKGQSPTPQHQGTLTTATASQENTQLLNDCWPCSFWWMHCTKGFPFCKANPHYPGIKNRVTSMLILAVIRNYVFL